MFWIWGLNQNADKEQIKEIGPESLTWSCSVVGVSINTHITFVVQRQINIRGWMRWGGGGCTDSRLVVALGLAVLERVGARGHFDKSTPEFLEDQVWLICHHSLDITAWSKWQVCTVICLYEDQIASCRKIKKIFRRSLLCFGDKIRVVKHKCNFELSFRFYIISQHWGRYYCLFLGNVRVMRRVMFLGTEDVGMDHNVVCVFLINK